MASEIKPISVYKPLDWQIPPLLCQDNILLLTGSAGGGKALALNTKVVTPTGFSPISDLHIGDKVLGGDGKPTTIVAATEVLYQRNCLKLFFENGQEVICDVNHLWKVHSWVDSFGRNADVQIVNAGELYRLQEYCVFHVKHMKRGRLEYLKILRIEETDSVPVRCIQVENPDGLFLITRDYITTHNSRLAGEKIHAYMKKYPGTMALIVRKQRNSMTNSTVLFMERTVIGDDPEVTHYPSKMRFEYGNGSILAYGGMDGDEQKEQIRSIGQAGALHIVWMEEANRFTEDDYNELLARMRGRGVSWRQIILTTNPDSGLHWIYQRLILGEEATVFYSNAVQNTYNPSDYIQTLDKLTGISRKRLTEGLWVQASGVVYENFRVEIHAVPNENYNFSGNPPKEWPRILSIDFGYTNPFVCLWGAIDPDGRIHIYKEIYYSKRTVKTHGARILEEIAKEGVDIDVIVCDHDAEDRETLNDLGLPNISAQKEVERGIQVVEDRMVVQDDGLPRIFFYKSGLLEVDPNLRAKKKPVRLLDEIQGYVWKETKDTTNPKEEPLKLNDHSCDALRYMVMYVDTFESQGMDHN